jgi:hypothetical protein
MSESEAERFEKVVGEFLAEGLHIRRGWTADEYREVCRKAWDKCHSSLAFPSKVLVDPLKSMEKMFAEAPQDYVHWRAADEFETQRGPSTDIRCVAMGLIKPDLSTGPDDEAPVATEEPEVPESRRYLIAVFDVLGFSALLQERGLGAVTDLYARLIDEAVTKEATRTHTLVRLSGNQMASIWCGLPVRHAHFSDTILLWVPLVQHFIAAFMARCADMVCEALQMGLPLRGGLAAGTAVMHSRTGTFVGDPIVEAARLEQSQDWFGVSLGDSMLAADISSEFDPQLVLPYAVPLKKGRARVYANLALDWPRRFRVRYQKDPIEAIRAVDRSPRHHLYYDNAVKFAQFSGGPIFRSDGLRPPNLSELGSAAVEARRTGRSLDQGDELTLKDLARTGEAGDTVARFVRSIARGEKPARVPDGLPPGLRRYLRQLSLAADGPARFVKLVPAIIDVMCSRFCGTPFSEEGSAILSDLEQLGGDGQDVATFLRAIEAGHAAAIPRKLPTGMRPFLKQALDWINQARIPAGLVRQVAEACLNARLGYQSLEENMSRALAAIDATGKDGSQIASFLRGIADGVDPLVPTDLPERLQSDLIRVQLGSRLAGVQAPRMSEITAVGFGDPPTGVDLFSLAKALVTLRGSTTNVPMQFEQAIHQFESGAPQRAVVGERLRSLLNNPSSSLVSERLPIAIRLILVQLDAVAEGKPIPLDPSLVGLAAIRMRHGGGPMGDCILFSLCAMSKAHEESRILADYLWKIANRSPAGPAPTLKNRQLAEVAEEVRCLADKEVGGIRLMMTEAK